MTTSTPHHQGRANRPRWHHMMISILLGTIPINQYDCKSMVCDVHCNGEYTFCDQSMSVTALCLDHLSSNNVNSWVTSLLEPELQ